MCNFFSKRIFYFLSIVVFALCGLPGSTYEEDVKKLENQIKNYEKKLSTQEKENLANLLEEEIADRIINKKEKDNLFLEELIKLLNLRRKEESSSGDKRIFGDTIPKKYKKEMAKLIQEDLKEYKKKYKEPIFFESKLQYIEEELRRAENFQVNRKLLKIAVVAVILSLFSFVGRWLVAPKSEVKKEIEQDKKPKNTIKKGGKWVWDPKM